MTTFMLSTIYFLENVIKLNLKDTKRKGWLPLNICVETYGIKELSQCHLMQSINWINDTLQKHEIHVCIMYII